jgi:hypothetical protein
VGGWLAKNGFNRPPLEGTDSSAHFDGADLICAWRSAQGSWFFKPNHGLGFVAFHRFQVLSMRLWHGHFAAIPHLSAPTNALCVDDASSSSATPWVVCHFFPLKMNKA